MCSNEDRLSLFNKADGGLLERIEGKGICLGRLCGGREVGCDVIGGEGGEGDDAPAVGGDDFLVLGDGGLHPFGRARVIGIGLARAFAQAFLASLLVVLVLVLVLVFILVNVFNLDLVLVLVLDLILVLVRSFALNSPLFTNTLFSNESIIHTTIL